MVQNLKLTAHTTFLLTLAVVEQNAFYNQRVNLAACVFEAIEDGDEEGAKKLLTAAKLPSGLENRTLLMAADILRNSSSIERYKRLRTKLNSGFSAGTAHLEAEMPSESVCGLSTFGGILYLLHLKKLEKMFQPSPIIVKPPLTYDTNLDDEEGKRYYAEIMKQARLHKKEFDNWLTEQTRDKWYRYDPSTKGLSVDLLDAFFERHITKPRTKHPYKHLTDTSIAKTFGMEPETFSKAQSAIAAALEIELPDAPGRGRRRVK